MRLRNKTVYDPQYLKRLFRECERREGAEYSRYCVTIRISRLVEVVHSRNGYVSGRATMNGTWIKMRLPKPGKARGYPDVKLARRAARVFIHELGHNLGLHHKDMMPSEQIEVLWWPNEDIPVRREDRRCHDPETESSGRAGVVRNAAGQDRVSDPARP